MGHWGSPSDERELPGGAWSLLPVDEPGDHEGPRPAHLCACGAPAAYLAVVVFRNGKEVQLPDRCAACAQ